jgi:hypothetical protein
MYGTNLGEAGIYEQIQAPAEYLVTHKNSNVQVPNHQSTRVFCSIGPFSSNREANSDEIYDEYDGEKPPG